MGTPVSGPGQFSQRTDKQPMQALPNANYGENKDYQEQQSGAPMAADSGHIAQSFGSLFGNPANGVVGLNADSTMPDVPVTDGASLGPGQGPEALSSSQNPQNQSAAAWLPALEFMANQPGSSESARNLVRQLKSQL